MAKAIAVHTSCDIVTFMSDSSLKIFKVLTSGHEAHMITAFLQSNGLNAHIVGAREYASIVAGGDVGRYEIQLPEDEFDTATKLLREKETPKAPKLKRTYQQEFKHAVTWVLAASFFPIILNIPAIIALVAYAKKAPAGTTKNLAILALILANVLSLLPLFYFFKS